MDRLTPIGSLSIPDSKTGLFMASSLRAADRATLGDFRWILWKVAPISPAGGGENSAFQELLVE